MSVWIQLAMLLSGGTFLGVRFWGYVSGGTFLGVRFGADVDDIVHDLVEHGELAFLSPAGGRCTNGRIGPM